MSVLEQLNEDLKTAMKSGEKEKVSTIRMAKAAIQNAKIKKGQDLSQEEIIEVLFKEVKQRKDAIPQFSGHPDKVEALEREIAILNQYLPQLMGEDEIMRVIRESIAVLNPAGPKEKGKVMGYLMPKLKGKADGQAVSRLVDKALTEL
ncbi:GatB/YqeY domain-containing protein [Zhaonella formicivorans]|jgi:hypothetical protein|uniref:GatB/YqeY domain-containing protein n=1 Tax=Zhaonella formicivorans TaxID=2528593 RepID=UPI0010E0452D|nr:GatB/YqeY domain-containing protein [Zhaonella formicivorans]